MKIHNFFYFLNKAQSNTSISVSESIKLHYKDFCHSVVPSVTNCVFCLSVNQ